MSRRERLAWSVYVVCGIGIMASSIPSLAKAWRYGSWDLFILYAAIVGFCGAATLAVLVWVVWPGKPKE